jgi:putative membrane protein
MFVRLFCHWVILVFGLYLVTLITPIHADAPNDLFWAAAVLIVANTIIKPVLILFTLPLVILSLGLFLLIINAIILYTVPHFVSGFHVPGFLSAFFGSILLSLITGLFTGYEKRVTVHRVNVGPSRPASSDKVIDI